MTFSGILSLMNREKVDRINTDRTYTSASNMASTASVLLNPTSVYPGAPPPPQPYSTGWPTPPAKLVVGLNSPPESRRTSDNHPEPPPPIQTTTQVRQSLPSIHEALSSGPKSNPYASPVSASLPQSHHQLPYSHPQAPPISRTYPTEHAPYPAHARHESPLQPTYPQSNPFGRPESTPTTFAENGRQGPVNTLQPAPGPPPNPYTATRFDPRYDHDTRAPERLPGNFTHNPPPQHSGYSYAPPGPQPVQMGQHPPFSQPRFSPRDERDPIVGWKGRGEDKPVSPVFKQGLKRQLEYWDFENGLAEIHINAIAIQEWSHHFTKIAQEQQRQTPDRMPTKEQCDEMLVHQKKINDALLRMRETIEDQNKYAAEQRLREHGGKGPSSYDEDMSMYDDGRENQSFGSLEGKKRRGVRFPFSSSGCHSNIWQRAAPPGRCHSCNRAETPEWRRGPDGARTLCNACGLHYAKLTRKNTLKQSQGSNGSSLRPKDDHSPRAL